MPCIPAVLCCAALREVYLPDRLCNFFPSFHLIIKRSPNHAIPSLTPSPHTYTVTFLNTPETFYLTPQSHQSPPAFTPTFTFAWPFHRKTASNTLTPRRIIQHLEHILGTDRTIPSAAMSRGYAANLHSVEIICGV
jgi:hypothetical protein